MAAQSSGLQGDRRRTKRTSIGSSRNSRPVNKSAKKATKRYQGQGR